MADHDLSRITDANGDNWNIKAKALEGQIIISTTGDVSGSSTATDLSGNVSIAQTIGDGKVTSGKIADSAVTNAKIADGSVNWDKIASSVKDGSIAGNYSQKLATCAQVKTYVDEQITGHGSYLGQKTVAQVNALTVMNNGDHVSVSNAGAITNPDGSSTNVNAGDNVIYDGTLRKWDCLAGDYKVKQTAKSDPAASGTGYQFIATISQDANGDITATKQSVREATTSQSGLMTAAQVQALNAKEGSFTIKYNSTDNSLVFSKAFGTA